MQSVSRRDPQFNLRIPAALKARIEDAAKFNKRSATAEIIARIERTFWMDEDCYKDLPDPPDQDVIQEQEEELTPFAAIALDREMTRLQAQMELVKRLAEQVSARFKDKADD